MKKAKINYEVIGDVIIIAIGVGVCMSCWCGELSHLGNCAPVIALCGAGGALVGVGNLFRRYMLWRRMR